MPKFKYDKQKHKRKNIKKSFPKDCKGVYWKSTQTKINVENLTRKDEIESFWKSVWWKNNIFNKDASWINNFHINYCKDVKQNVYLIDLKMLPPLIKSIQGKLQVEILSSDFGTKKWVQWRMFCYVGTKHRRRGKSIFLIGYY